MRGCCAQRWDAWDSPWGQQVPRRRHREGGNRGERVRTKREKNEALAKDVCRAGMTACRRSATPRRNELRRDVCLESGSVKSTCLGVTYLALPRLSERVAVSPLDLGASYAAEDEIPKQSLPGYLHATFPKRFTACNIVSLNCCRKVWQASTYFVHR